MNLSNSDECRICLKTNVFFEWTEAIFEFSGPTYKECYYQYTHIQEEEDEDIFTQMLCLDCANGLRNTYQLIEKALESDKILKESKRVVNQKSLQVKYEVDPFILETHDIIETDNQKQEISLTEVSVMDVQNESSQNSCQESESEYNESSNLQNDFSQDHQQESESESTKSSNLQNASKGKKKKGNSLLCSYCPKIFYSRNHLENHEKRRHKHRERTVPCHICGLKFYEEMALKCHMPIHDENREREYKCEFCPKAFFGRGSLNVHRRIHLGQMVKCQFCPKEYFRQCDLERHMKIHGVEPITAVSTTERKGQRKYYMECNTCGQKVNRNNWESHKARHLNKPQVQCGICSKEYFSRQSLLDHLSKYHGLTREDYDTYVITLGPKFKPRLTRLMIEQKLVEVYTEK